ncbi:MAG: ribonuclease HI family protein [Patescibacteria group bacterium]|mgnify:CR=1 FL=1
MKLIVHTDGGARGNPGPAAVGVVIERQEESKVESPAAEALAGRQKSKVLAAEFGKRIGETTNNVAEYTAVVEALTYLKIKTLNFKLESGEDLHIQFLLDSKLVVEQLNGNFKVKDGRLRELMMKVKVLEQEVGPPGGETRGVVTYAYVPREQNKRADYFVNKALDA